MLALERRNLILEKLQAASFMMSLKRPYAVIWINLKRKDLR